MTAPIIGLAHDPFAVDGPEQSAPANDGWTTHTADGVPCEYVYRRNGVVLVRVRRDGAEWRCTGTDINRFCGKSLAGCVKDNVMWLDMRRREDEARLDALNRFLTELEAKVKP